MSDGPDRRSILGELAGSLVGGAAGDEIREWATSQNRNDLTTAVGLGLAAGDAATDRRETPPIRVTEREDDDGRLVGVRVVVDVPPEHAQLFMSEESALLRLPDCEVEIPLPFAAGDVEAQHDTGSTVSDWIIRRSTINATDAE